MNEISITVDYTPQGIKTNVAQLVSQLKPQLENYRYEVNAQNMK